jgi:hypothetical protein
MRSAEKANGAGSRSALAPRRDSLTAGIVAASALAVVSWRARRQKGVICAPGTTLRTCRKAPRGARPRASAGRSAGTGRIATGGRSDSRCRCSRSSRRACLRWRAWPRCASRAGCDTNAACPYGGDRGVLVVVLESLSAGCPAGLGPRNAAGSGQRGPGQRGRPAGPWQR